MPIINGKQRISDIPCSGVYGDDLIKEMKPDAGRRAVIRRGGTQFETIEPKRHYSKKDLLDKKGKPVKVDIIPDRCKGGFGGVRSTLSKQIITEQVWDIAEHLFKNGVQFDEDNADWVIIPNYRLPSNWHSIARTSDLLIAFPTEYPTLPPIGFYLMANLPSPHGHLFDFTAHDAWQAPLQKGWQWYCAYIPPGAWRPKQVRKRGDWRFGDNLWTYCTLVSEILASGR